MSYLTYIHTILASKQFEPQHDKTNKMTYAPSMTRIIRPGWSESSLCVQWVIKDPRFLHADSEDSDQTGQMPREGSDQPGHLPRPIRAFAGHTGHFVGFVMRQLNCSWFWAGVNWEVQERGVLTQLSRDQHYNGIVWW